jgi:hypothetical protein
MRQILNMDFSPKRTISSTLRIHCQHEKTNIQKLATEEEFLFFCQHQGHPD